MTPQFKSATKAARSCRSRQWYTVFNRRVRETLVGSAGPELIPGYEKDASWAEEPTGPEP